MSASLEGNGTRLRIVHLVPNLNYGGLQKVVQLLALHQVQAGHAVTVISWDNLNNHPEAEQELLAARVMILYPRRGPSGKTAHGMKYTTLRLRAILRDLQADILHVHNPFDYFIFAALAAKLTGRTKTVNTIHLTMMFDSPVFGRRGRTLFWIAAMLSSGLISVCAEVSDYVDRRFLLPGVKKFTVENGIDLSPFLVVPDRVQGCKIVFGFAGRMRTEKNHRMLIEAFSLVRKMHSDICLRLLGGGPLEPGLKDQVAHLSLEEAVEFCGFGHDVPAFLATLDAYILPSNFEAHPLSLIEAIASGLPVVATRVGGVPKMIMETGSGWLCEPNNPEAMAAAIDLAICEIRHGRDTRSARQVASRLYSAQRMASDHEEVYHEILR